MLFWAVVSDILAHFVCKVVCKVAPVLWRWLCPVGCRMWSAFAVRAGRYGYWHRFSEDLRRNKPFWIIAASMTAATWGFGVWYSVTGSTKGDTIAEALVLTTYAFTALLIGQCLWRLGRWAKRRVA